MVSGPSLPRDLQCMSGRVDRQSEDAADDAITGPRTYLGNCKAPTVNGFLSAYARQGIR